MYRIATSRTVALALVGIVLMAVMPGTAEVLRKIDYQGRLTGSAYDARSVNEGQSGSVSSDMITGTS